MENKLAPVLWKLSLRIIGITLLFLFIILTEKIILFFSLAFFTAIALNPLVSFLERKKISRRISALMLIFSIILCLGGIIFLVTPVVIQQLSDLLINLPTIVDSLSKQIMNIFPSSFVGTSFNLNHILITQFIPSTQKIVTGVSSITFSFINIVIYTVSFFSIVGYSLANPKPFFIVYLRIFPKQHRKQAALAYRRGAKMTVGWLKTNIIEGFILGILSWVFLSLLGVPGASVWGIFTFSSSLVPRLGPYIMTIFPTIIAFAIDPLKALWVILFYIGTNEFVGDIIDPYIRSSQMKINPVLIIFAIFSMTYAFGILGAFIAAPVAGFIKAFYETFFVGKQNDVIKYLNTMSNKRG